MPASYPSGFDSPADAGANLNTNPHSAMHDLTNDIVEAIEAELGLSPSGASSTVAARFTADEALISKSYTICTSGTRPSSPTEGDKIFETDTNKILVYSGAAWSTIGPVHGTLTAWTPILVQSGTVTTSATSTFYSRVGRLVIAKFLITPSGAGTANNVITVSLPVAADAGWITDYLSLGVGFINDASASAKYEGVFTLASTTTVKFRDTLSGVSPPRFLGATGASFAAALASGDFMSGSLIYPAGADA